MSALRNHYTREAVILDLGFEAGQCSVIYVSTRNVMATRKVGEMCPIFSVTTNSLLESPIPQHSIQDYVHVPYCNPSAVY